MIHIIRTKVISMVLFGVLLAVLPLGLAAQQRGAADPLAPLPEDWEVRIIPVTQPISAQLMQTLQLFGIQVVSHQDLGTIAVRAPQSMMTSIEEAVRRLDVAPPAPKTADLTIYILMASDQPEQMMPIPPSLEPVLNQLRDLLPYREYSLFDTLVTQAIHGQSFTLGGSYRFASYSSANLSASVLRPVVFDEASDGAPIIRLNNFSFSLRDGSTTPRNEFLGFLDTSVDIPIGAYVVVGKTTIGERSFILVIHAAMRN